MLECPLGEPHRNGDDIDVHDVLVDKGGEVARRLMIGTTDVKPRTNFGEHKPLKIVLPLRKHSSTIRSRNIVERGD